MDMNKLLKFNQNIWINILDSIQSINLRDVLMKYAPQYILYSLLSSILIIIVNKFALLKHAYSLNIRLPFEGVQFIDFAIFILSFVCFLFLRIGVTMLSLCIDGAISLFRKAGGFPRKNEFILLLKIVFCVVIIATIVFCIALPIFWAQENLVSNYNVNRSFWEVAAENFVYVLSIPLSLYIIFLYWYGKQWQQVFKNTISFGVVLMMMVLSFSQEVYENFLANIKYGGHIPVTIKAVNETQEYEVVEGRLILRTNTHFIIENKDDLLVEVPKDKTFKIEYY